MANLASTGHGLPLADPGAQKIPPPSTFRDRFIPLFDIASKLRIGSSGADVAEIDKIIT